MNENADTIRKSWPGRAALLLCTAGCLLAAAGCVPMKQARVAAVALTMQDVARAASKQSDVTVVREGTPAYLMLLDGLLESYPKNADLLMAACQAYSSYASSFVGDDDPATAVALYLKASRYGFEALSKQGDFRKAASSGREEFTKFLERCSARDVPNLFWTTTAWAGWIAASTGSVESMADLPALEATMERILALDETFYYGGPHLLQAVYLAAKPNIMGGDLAKAKRHFDRAFALGSDRLLMAKVYFAQYYARGMKDRALYESTLRDVLAAPVDAVPELTLANTIAREKARKLLDRTEEYFEEPL